MQKVLRGFSVLVLGVALLSGSAAMASDGSLGFHRASANASKGLRSMTLASGEKVFMSPRATWTSLDVTSAELSSDGGVELVFSGEASRRLMNMAAQPDARLAVMLGNKILSAGSIDADGVVTVSGLSVDESDRLTRLANGEPLTLTGPVFTAVSTGSYKGRYYVDVFAHGVSGLRSFQAKLVVGGGDSGTLILEDVRIDKSRSDFVFSTSQIVEASSPFSGKLSAVLYDGTVDVSQPAYLGTFTFVASSDASGTFRVNIENSENSLLGDGGTGRIPYNVGADTTVLVGGSRRRTGDR